MVCLIIFGIFTILFIVGMIFALVKSGKNDILTVYDSSGNICGKDSMADYPYLYL